MVSETPDAIKAGRREWSALGVLVLVVTLLAPMFHGQHGHEEPAAEDRPA